MERRRHFVVRKTDSESLLQNHSPTSLKIPEGKEAAVLFLCSKNVHEDHEDVMPRSGGCGICRLIDKFADAIKKQSSVPLQREVTVKTLRMSKSMFSDLSVSTDSSTLENNFLHANQDLDDDDEEILTFTEVLDLMDVEVPEDFRAKADSIIVEKRIPISKKDKSESAHKKRFLSYTLNKKLYEICEMLTLEEVCLMKDALNTDKEGLQDVLALASAFSIIQYSEKLEEVKGMKDVIFCYIILNMLKESMLNRIYTHSLEILLKHVYISSKDKERIQKAIDVLKRYLLTADPPGVCLIFSMQIDRQGAEADVKNLKNFFGGTLNYDILIKMDPTSKDIKNTVAELGASRYQFYDSLVVCFMAHGDKTHLRLKDGQIHRRTDLLQPFSEITWLKHKPKLFFIQACANRNPRKSVTEETLGGLRARTDSVSFGLHTGKPWQNYYGNFVNIEEVNPMSNSLVSYATLWYREAATTEHGSLYFNTLLDSLRRYGDTQSIEDVLRDMHYHVNTVQLAGKDVDATWKQTPYYESTLSKKFVFPKIIQDDSG